jgi:hypothetical protein
MERLMKRAIFMAIILNSLLVACLLALGGCNGSSPTTQLPPLSPPTATATLPPNGGLPSDIPLYPGAQPIGAPTQNQASFQSSASQETISTFYQQQMPQHGWKTVQVQDNGPDGIILTFSKDTRVAHFVISPGIGNGGSAVLITLTSQ